MSRLRASFESVAKGEEKGKEGGEVPLSSFPFYRADGAGGGGEGGGNRLTGLAVTLHGGASLAWEQRYVSVGSHVTFLL